MNPDITLGDPSRGAGGFNPLDEFLRTTRDGIYCFQYDRPVSLELPEEEQFEMLRRARFLLVSDVYAEGLGARKEDLIGTVVEDTLSYSDPQRRGFAIEFIRARYGLFRSEWTTPLGNGASATHVVTHMG